MAQVLCLIFDKNGLGKIHFVFHKLIWQHYSLLSRSNPAINSNSSVKSFCQLDLMINLQQESSPDLRCYKIAAPHVDIFNPRSNGFNYARQTSAADVAPLPDEDPRSTPIKFGGMRDNIFFEPNARPQSCRLSRYLSYQTHVFQFYSFL
jgi:hypothetical protein